LKETKTKKGKLNEKRNFSNTSAVCCGFGRWWRQMLGLQVREAQRLVNHVDGIVANFKKHVSAKTNFSVG